MTASTNAAPLDGHTAVVTGASRGIGLAIAKRLAGAGARIAICSRATDADGETRLAAAADAIRSVAATGAEVVWLRCDVTHFADVRRLHAAVDKELGVPFLLVNNAGLVVRKRLDETTEDEWDAVVGANLKGTFNVTRVFLPQMRSRGSGRIINIASISGRQGTARLTAYCAAKHGVVGFSRALAEELKPDNVRVTAICAGSIATEFFDRFRPTPRCSPAPVSRR